ncbi:fructosamine kinase family protein [Acaryochloris marina]|uniref:fructosamine kinase family protein n=1 Tax=Acaryochloris marina TaxID=155978 RepID=UPI001BAEBC54|nr:fructosamine kinase family protein [Acaryochloris marina]QUY42163.1 fructosamine kinase family protein [Acaryochloris marina S15]
MSVWTEIQHQISQVQGQEFAIATRNSVGGGSINQAYQVSDGQEHYFVKLNQASKVAMFEAEAEGLKDMQASQSIRVPKPLGWGAAEGQSYIILEWIPLGHGDAQTWFAMGQQLAAMHRQAHDQGFGWHQNNTIGATPQRNPWTEHWGEFFAEHRIGYQLQLAQRHGGQFRQGDALVDKIPALLTHPVESSLVHGDLWSGNAAFSHGGEPIILDPATYYGDREVDIAMTELFGGFPPAFYRGYQEAWPLDKGYQQRKTLYNLYHILNHFNLFGGGYASQAQGMIEQILAMV